MKFRKKEEPINFQQQRQGRYCQWLAPMITLVALHLWVPVVAPFKGINYRQKGSFR
jgi:hypothetical protein